MHLAFIYIKGILELIFTMGHGYIKMCLTSTYNVLAFCNRNLIMTWYKPNLAYYFNIIYIGNCMYNNNQNILIKIDVTYILYI